jgi:ribonuclease HII
VPACNNHQYPWTNLQPSQFTIYLDEAWRGPLAGPVYVWAVTSLRHIDTTWFADSKAIPEQKRIAIYNTLPWRELAGELVYGSGYAGAEYIDRFGIVCAIQKACLYAIGAVFQKFWQRSWRSSLEQSSYGDDQLAYLHLEKYFDLLDKSRSLSRYALILQAIINVPQRVIHFKWIIIDGNQTFGLDKLLGCRVLSIIWWDAKNPLVSLASIIAKVERDYYMQGVSKRVDNRYGFSIHKGYGTPTHRARIAQYGLSKEHRASYGNTAYPRSPSPLRSAFSGSLKPLPLRMLKPTKKPWLLLHICCAPDLTRPLHWLKQFFHLYLFWYNPNIHPRREHDKRYEQFISLVWLENWTYTILEDWYDPKEFFRAMIEQKTTIDHRLANADDATVLKQAWAMPERSDRCNPCYAMRLDQAAKNATRYGIPFFTSTLLISPKKKMDKLFRWWKEAEYNNPWSKFLWFDFIKHWWYEQANKLTKKYGLRRQQYCWCGWTIPKPWTQQTQKVW